MYKYLVILICWVQILSAQDTYVKVIDHDETRLGLQIVRYGDRYFIHSGGIYNNQHEGVVVMEIDLEANIIWEKHLPWIDVAPSSMIIKDDIITLSGNHNPDQTEFYLHEMSVDGGDSLTTHIIDDDRIDLERMFHLSTIHYQDKYLIAGSARLVDTAYAIIFVVDDTTGEVDSLFIPDQNERNTDIWDILEDKDGNFVAFFNIRFNDNTNIRTIKKYNSELEEIWSYTTESLFTNLSVPRGTELHDGRIAFTYGDPDGQHEKHAIRVINPDMSVDWQYDWSEIVSVGTSLFNIETAKDGSIYAMGHHTKFIATPRIEMAPFIIKISPDGELIWERSYIELDEDGNNKTGLIFDVEELDDGTVMAIGRLRNDNGDILIMRLDSEGCLIEDCEAVSVFTDTDDIEESDTEFSIYPNPTLDQLNISSQKIYETIKLYNIDGRLQQTLGYDSTINVERLNKGIYLIELVDINKKSQWSKFVKM